jgi:hypothetical protein
MWKSSSRIHVARAAAVAFFTFKSHGALAGQQVNEDQEDYLLVLSGIVGRYESETLPAPRPVSGLAMLKYVLEKNRQTGDDLGTILDVDRSVA